MLKQENSRKIPVVAGQLKRIPANVCIRESALVVQPVLAL